jgi:Na+/proline symporter
VSPLLLGVLGYVFLQLVVGVWISRRIRTEEDYLLAGRSLGPWLATASIFATWFGAETCIGAASEVYARGWAGATHDPFGYALCLLLAGVVFARALWRRGLVTLADLYRDRFGAGAERLAIVLMAPTSLLWAAAQIRAFGQVLASVSGHDAAWMTALAAGVVILYTVSGGILADATTDIVQGVALIVGLVVLLVAVVSSGASMPAAAAAPLAPARPWLNVLNDWLVPILGSVTAQEMISRILASRSPNLARNATIGAAGIYVAVGLIPVTLGLYGASMLPGLASPEQVLPALAARHLGTVMHVVFAGALVSAILSTVDSALLAASSVVVHNGVLRLMPAASEGRKVLLNRVGVAIAGVLAYAIAFSADSVYDLVAQASAFGGAGLFVAMAAGLWDRKAVPAAGIAALATGAVVQLVGDYGLGWPNAFTASLVAAVAAYSTVTLFARFRG